MNKEKYEKIQMEVVELKEDIIVTSCSGVGFGCNFYCDGEGGSQCGSYSSCSYIASNSTNINPISGEVCIGGDMGGSGGGTGCSSGDMGTGCSPVSCSEESFSPVNPKP